MGGSGTDLGLKPHGADRPGAAAAPAGKLFELTYAQAGFLATAHSYGYATVQITGLQRPRHNVLTCLIPSSMPCWRSYNHRCPPARDSTQVIPPLTFTENGTDPGCCQDVVASFGLYRCVRFDH
jgi:hypothetical protein